ncbi:sugar-binding transcriptional regulator [Phyllobacterium myrsinacearum]|uniref:DNA-binding transcriptional regulator LsrR (DeoR family) n=1 Tax=Phyllobacterium myrsinacearum TaxID=28101 RepID=A0A839EH83_9HYPH|nr:sugar-binding domain-containing protein [Phyllobacterium myrsinacearum]MBA8879623.1 DNA-binding transcriptional regulator LsrR (DeoR family) [Phyllobacterium myrsinacearum]
MARTQRSIESIVEIARMRYDERQTPVEIAWKLDISTSTVSRALKLAMQMGFVEIRVTAAGYRDLTLEAALVQKFGLRQAFVVRHESGVNALNTVARVVASHLEDQMVAGTILGVSDGESVAAVADCVRRGKSDDIDIVSMIGGVGSPQVHTHSTEICSVMAKNANGRTWQLPAPAFVVDVRKAAGFMEETLVRSVFSMIERATIAVVGIGAMSPQAAIFRHGMLDAKAMDTLSNKGAVGSICARFFDAEGRTINSEFDDRTMAVSLEALRRIPDRLGVAVGTEKITAISASMRGRLINGIATDRDTAEALLSNPPEGHS